jgi:ATP-dependent helicase/nuclease subunit B
MSVTFVIGRAGSGKTERCFSRIIAALRDEPLGPPIFWILPRQATFVTERRLTCAAGLEGFCRARVLSFDQLGQEIFAACGGSAVPEVTVIGRQMILGHLLRRHSSRLLFFKSTERQAGLAAELDATFDELERAGKNAADLAALISDLSHCGPLDVEGESLRAKLQDVRLLYDAYLDYLGQDRLDPHRRLRQVLESVASCSFLPGSAFYVDGFFEFTDHERRMLGAIAKAGARMEITVLMDPGSPLLRDPHPLPDEMGLFHRTETTYRRLWFTLKEENVAVDPPVMLGDVRRFESAMLARVEGEMFGALPTPGAAGAPTGGLHAAIPIPPVRAPAALARDADAMVSDADPTKSEREISPVGCAPRTADRETVPVADVAEHGDPRRDRAAKPQAAESSAIERIEAPDRVAEVDAVARRVRGMLVEGHRLRDIAVLVRGLENYHQIIAASFDEHEIPFFVDRRRSAAHHPVLQLLRGALEAARADWNHDAVVALMKTGLAGLSLDEADELENYVLLHRVRGAQWESPQPWAWRRDLLRWEDAPNSPAAANPLLIDELRRRIADGLSPLVQLLKPGMALPLRKIAEEIFAMFERFGVRQTLSRWIAAAAAPAADVAADGEVASRLEAGEEHEQVWVKLAETFDQMVDLLGDEKVTPGDFADIVESALERLDLAITPPTVDQVLVGQVDRTRCPPVKAVFVLGLNEAEFPAAPRETTVLSDRERRELSRRRLELDSDGARLLLDERMLGYVAFTQASQRLILCRPQGDDAGRPVAPSAFWVRIGAMFPAVPTEFVRRGHTEDAAQIATPRQLVAGLMGWIRGGMGILPMLGGVPESATQQGKTTTVRFSAGDNLCLGKGASATTRFGHGQDAHATLYQWLVTHGKENPAIDRLRRRAWRALSYTNDAALSPEAPALFAAPLATDAVQLETMAACPFRHFARYGLKLSPRERPGVNAGDLGQIYHRLLDRLVAQSLRTSDGGRTDPFAISADAIHVATQQIAKRIRGELLLSTARNRYLLQWVERTIGEVIASQRALMQRTRYRPARTAISYGPDSEVRSVPVNTPRGSKVFVRGQIDRLDTLDDTGDAIVFDYRMGNSILTLADVYHGLKLQLLVHLLALESGAEDLERPPLNPAGAFYLRLLRTFEDVKHPDEAPDPAAEDYLLKVKPRGLFDSRAFADLAGGFETGASKVVSTYVKKDGSYGKLNSTDVADSDVFRALLAHVVRRIGELGDQVLAGDVAISPYRLSQYSPCKSCEFRGLCRFETSVNRYHHLEAMKREEVMEKVRTQA